VSAPLAFITGASSGIGQALAAHYARAGWRLALVARRTVETQDWLGAQGLGADRARVYSADVRDLDAITGVGRECLDRQGLPDVVIASAGVSIGVDTALPGDLAVMRRVLETNLLGTAATFQPFIAPMCERRSGALVGISSVAAIRGLAGHGAYCASKAGVVSYCESLRLECRPFGVRVVTIGPGYIDTPLTQRNRYAMPFLMAPDDFAARAARCIAVGRSYQVIPWQMGVVAKLMRALPNPLYDRLFSGRARKHRDGE
jgi:NAD(P)-dependent dehydrogenase (short-subunit alcohol dehydrogenase family)